MIKYIGYSFLLACALYGQANHLLLSTIVITPDSAEMVIIKNPTGSDINLNNYYLTDATDTDVQYYNLPSGENYWDNDSRDFLVNFPDIILEAGDSLFISMRSSDIFSNYYGFECDFSLSGTQNILVGDIGLLIELNVAGTLNDYRETLILFYWDENSNLVQDVDYFLWNESNYDSLNPVAHQYAIDKTSIDGYLPDTPINQQIYKINHSENYSFIRTQLEEINEISIGGNGITGHNETSENMMNSWQILYNPLFIFGCTNSTACNYNPDANSDVGNCRYPEEYYNCDNNCINDQDYDEICDEVEEFYFCDLCDPIEDVINGDFDNQFVVIQGMVVDYFDVTVFNGPHSITIEDQSGLKVEVVVWPDNWDLPTSEFGDILNSPYQRYILRAIGVVGEYNNEKQIDVTSENNFLVQEWVNNTEKISLEVAPYPFVPSMGERIKYSFIAPNYDRLIIRIFDISGRFITTLYDGMPPFGSQINYWNGRTHLGELVMPGTYLIQLEATGFSSGKSQTTMAPIVVGAKLK